MLDRRQILAAGLALPAATALASCGPNASGGNGGGDGSPSLRFTWWGNSTRHELTQQVVDDYTTREEAPAISTEPGEWSGYWDKLATQTAGGDAPDIIQMDEKYMAEFGTRGQLLDLGAAGFDTSSFAEGTVPVGELGDGQLVGINAGINAFSVIANPAVFEAAGIDLPDDTTWTWDELLDIAARITSATDGGTYGVNQIGLNETTFHVYLRQLGLDRYEGGGLAFDAAAATEYYEFVQTIQDSGAGPEASLAIEDGAAGFDQSRFNTGRAAMTVALSNQAVAHHDAVSTGIEILRPPSLTGSAADVGLWYKASMYWSISANAADPEAALDFVDFLSNSTDAGTILSVERGVPPNLEVREAITPDLDDINLRVVEYLESIEGELGPAPELTPPGAGELMNIINRAGEDMLFGTITPAEAGARLVEELEAAIS
ncbi:ABC transporter substrate-binding protein [Brachybacterium sp.]|uniref:ABC transporter substrate-binding protein n=1 Tax=Brachybacterium sp. TaxID=1891286 RepID=UPI002ED4B62B